MFYQIRLASANESDTILKAQLRITTTLIKVRLALARANIQKVHFFHFLTIVRNTLLINYFYY